MAETVEASPEAPSEFIRIEITNMTLTEIDAVKKAMRDVMSGKTYRFTRHFCYHEDKQRCNAVEEV